MSKAKEIEITTTEERSDGIVVTMSRSGKEYEYCKDWNGKESLFVKNGLDVVPYGSHRLIKAARKSHGFPSTKN